MLVTLKLYAVVTEPGPAICELTGVPLDTLATTYILALDTELAAQRAGEVIGRLITTGQVTQARSKTWARALIKKKLLSRQGEMVVVVGHHAYQSGDIVRVSPGHNHGEIIGQWRKAHGGMTMAYGPTFAMVF